MNLPAPNASAQLTAAELRAALRAHFGGRLLLDEPLARHTSARLGGLADAMLVVNSAAELTDAVQYLWGHRLPCRILGGGSNLLVSDAGVRLEEAILVLNRARATVFDAAGNQTSGPTVWAESGANFGMLARQAAAHGLAGLEWAAGIPGTLGGAVFGNAGAHKADMSTNLVMAEILHPDSPDTPQTWSLEQMQYTYRTSALKRLKAPPYSAPHAPRPVVLAARLSLQASTSQTVQTQIESFTEYRRRTQPPGASLGSMFKNPPGDYAGRLIEAAGLKGAQIGDAQISPLHANFFINLGQATAADIYALLTLAYQTVAEKFGIQLELEIELLGQFSLASDPAPMSLRGVPLYSTPLPPKQAHLPQPTPAPLAPVSVSPTLHICLLFGGRSGEHEVSVRSARSILNALDPQRYTVHQVGITHAGQWLSGPNALDAFERVASDQAALRGLTPAAILPDPARPGLHLFNGQQAVVQHIDVVMPILHGTFGEDGTLQGLLEMADLAYVGAGVLASSVGMDKGLFRDVMAANGIPVLETLVLSARDIHAQSAANGMLSVIERAEAACGAYPLFVKPANMGSSVGISKCKSRSDLLEGLMHAARYDRRILVQRGIPAREIEISVLGNEQPRASLPGEILPSREFYSYESKYLDDNSGLLIPAPLPEATIARAQSLAIQVYKAIDCAGMARVDFLLDTITGELYLNEINTIPGFTSISMYPKLWEASGLSYPALVDQLIELAVERKAERNRLERQYQAG